MTTNSNHRIAKVEDRISMNDLRITEVEGKLAAFVDWGEMLKGLAAQNEDQIQGIVDLQISVEKLNDALQKMREQLTTGGVQTSKPKTDDEPASTPDNKITIAGAVVDVPRKVIHIVNSIQSCDYDSVEDDPLVKMLRIADDMGIVFHQYSYPCKEIAAWESCFRIYTRYGEGILRAVFKMHQEVPNTQHKVTSWGHILEGVAYSLAMRRPVEAVTESLKRCRNLRQDAIRKKIGSLFPNKKRPTFAEAVSAILDEMYFKSKDSKKE